MSCYLDGHIFSDFIRLVYAKLRKISEHRPSLPLFNDYSNWNNVFNLYGSCSSLHCPYNGIQSCSCNRSEGTSPSRQGGYGSEDMCKSLSCGSSRNSCGCNSRLDGIFLCIFHFSLYDIILPTL